MKIKMEAISILKRFGYREREAGFLCLVAIHSGYFTQCQFAAFASIKPGGIVTAFTNKLVARGHASLHRYQNNAYVFHFHSKGMYSAIGKLISHPESVHLARAILAEHFGMFTLEPTIQGGEPA